MRGGSELLEFKAHRLINEVRNFSQDIENNTLKKELEGSVNCMIYNLQEANQTLVYAKKYLDIYSGRLINIKVNARMIRTYVDIYLENKLHLREEINFKFNVN